MPVTNFEKFTQVLSDKEKLLIQPLINVLKRQIGEEINSQKLINSVEQEYNSITGEHIWMKGHTLRILVNYLCVNRILPVASSSRGYWICKPSEFDEQIKSLRERANSILARADGLYEMKDGSYLAGGISKTHEDEF